MQLINALPQAGAEGNELVDGMTPYFLAMALWRDGQREAARQTLQRADVPRGRGLDLHILTRLQKETAELLEVKEDELQTDQSAADVRRAVNE